MMPLSLWKRLTPTKNRIPFSVEKNCARPSLDKQRLGELIDLISTLGLGDAENRSKDIIRRVYEYFLSEFASAEGRQGGQFYTPRCVVRTLVAMISPFKVRVYDPCCGSGGMFVQSEKFVEAHGGRIGDISIYGQESNPTTWKLAKMNLAIRGIDHDLGTEHADSFKRDLHPNLKADYILANPPFNMKDWGGENLKDDVRWKNGIPPTGNANYAWIQHFIHHLSPSGIVGFYASANLTGIARHGYVLTPGRYVGAEKSEIVNITACPGTDRCRFAMIDSISLARTLDEKFFGKEMPVKFRIAISSCSNSCVSERLNEIGITGVVRPYRVPGTCTGCGTCVKYCRENAIAIKNGQIRMNNDLCVHCGMCIQSCPFHIIKADPAAYHITIGGKRGRHPRVGYHVVTVKTPETVIKVVEKVVKWVYRKAWSDSLLPDQLGILDFESFKKELIADLDEDEIITGY